MGHTDTPQALKSKQRALLVSVATTACSLFPTIYVTIIANSVILYADLLRCVVEFLAILCSWFILGHISKSDRSRFNYGFGKLEQIASLVVASAMLLSFLVVLIAAISRFIVPAVVTNITSGLVLGSLSVAGNGAMWGYYRYLDKSQHSAVLDSQARLFRAKTVASAIVVIALLPQLINAPEWLRLYADPAGSVLLSGFLLHSAVALFSSSMNELIDASVEERLQLLILRVLIHHESLYTGFSGIRSRRIGKRILVELFLEFSPSTTMADFGSSATIIMTALNQEIPDIEVLVVPMVRAEPAA